jgi:uncharacterized protein YlxW (UPF0749 family)
MKKIQFTSMMAAFAGLFSTNPELKDKETEIQTAMDADARTISDDFQAQISSLQTERDGLQAKITQSEPRLLALGEYEKTGATVAEIKVLQDWHAAAKAVNAGAGGNDANDTPDVPRMSAATAQANEVYQKLHGKKPTE